MSTGVPARALTRGLEGWATARWLCAVLGAAFVGVLVGTGWSEEGVRALVRTTARTSLALFLLAFTASSLARLWRSGATAWLLRNRRQVGVSFAFSHLVHLAALVALGAAFPDPFLRELSVVAVAGGGLAYLFILAMTVTSFDRTAAWLGRRRWKRLHTVGSWVVWIVFAQSYLPRALVDPFYVPFALAVLAAPVLRVGVRWPGAARARA